MKARACLVLLALLATPAVAEKGLRDPFVRIQPASTQPSRLPLSVTGLMQSGDHYLAIVRYGDESRILQVGDFFEGTRVLNISPDGLTLGVLGEDRHVRVGDRDVTLSFQYAWNYCLEGAPAYAQARAK